MCLGGSPQWLQPAHVFELALFCHTSAIQTVIAGLKLRLFDRVELEQVCLHIPASQNLVTLATIGDR